MHVVCQAFSLGLTPALFYLLLYRPGAADALLTPSLAVGLMAAMCMPTTTNTGVMFVQQARGDASVAAINAAVGNLLGAFVAPLTASATLGGAVAQQDLPAVFLSLTEQVHRQSRNSPPEPAVSRRRVVASMRRARGIRRVGAGRARAD